MTTPTELLSEDRYWAKEEIKVCYQNIAYYKNFMVANNDYSTFKEYQSAKDLVKENYKRVIEHKKLLNFDYTIDEQRLKEL